MIFTTIGTNIDEFLARFTAFARGACEFRHDITWADPARSGDNAYTELDDAYDCGRDFAHRILRRIHDDDDPSAERPQEIRLPRVEPTFDGPPMQPPAVAQGDPLTLTCEGEVEYRQDYPGYGSYWLGTTVHLGDHHSIEAAISLASLALADDAFPLLHDDALGFSPRLFMLRDGDQRLVLAGRTWVDDIKWCEPVASDDEIARIQAEVSQTNTEASFEAGWDNHETARQLRRRADALKGHLVDIAWRERARHALHATGASRSLCPSPSDPLPVPSYARYAA